FLAINHLLPIRLAQPLLDIVPGSASERPRHGSTRLPSLAGRIPGPLRVRGGLSPVPGGMPLAGRLPLPAMRRARRLRDSWARAPAVPDVPAPDLGHSGHGPASDARSPPALVSGRLPGCHPHPGVLGGAAPAAARPRSVRDGLDDAAQTPPRDAPP